MGGYKKFTIYDLRLGKWINGKPSVAARTRDPDNRSRGRLKVPRTGRLESLPYMRCGLSASVGYRQVRMRPKGPDMLKHGHQTENAHRFRRLPPIARGRFRVAGLARD